jgi:hypothetical protein
MKKIIFITVLSFCATTLFAQGIRHVHGVKSFELGAGTSQVAKMFYGSYVNYFTSKLYLKGSLFYSMGEDKDLKFTAVGVDAGLNRTIFDLGEIFYFNLGGGLTFSVDQLNPAIKVYDEEGNVTENNYNTPKFGLFGNIETETFIHDKIVLIVGVNQKWLFGEEFGKTRWFATAGLRYNF